MFAFLAETAGHDDGSVAFPALDLWHYPSQIAWLTLTFGVLYWVLSKMILPRMSANLERRSDTIADDLGEAARLNENAQEAKQALEVSLAEARARARETASKAETKMNDEIAAETQKVDAQIDQKLAAAEKRLAELRADAMSNVETIASDTTQAILSRLGISGTTQADVKTAVTRVLNK